jgi:hypothetical protein
MHTFQLSTQPADAALNGTYALTSVTWDLEHSLPLADWGLAAHTVFTAGQHSTVGYSGPTMLHSNSGQGQQYAVAEGWSAVMRKPKLSDSGIISSV